MQRYTYMEFTVLFSINSQNKFQIELRCIIYKTPLYSVSAGLCCVVSPLLLVLRSLKTIAQWIMSLEGCIVIVSHSGCILLLFL